MNPKTNISDSLVHAEWDSVAQLLSTVDSGIQGTDAMSRKLRAELGVVKVIMYENLVSWNGNNSIDLSFYIASYKTIQKIERTFDTNGIKNREFLIFLKLLFYKFQKQT